MKNFPRLTTLVLTVCCCTMFSQTQPEAGFVSAMDTTTSFPGYYNPAKTLQNQEVALLSCSSSRGSHNRGRSSVPSFSFPAKELLQIIITAVALKDYDSTFEETFEKSAHNERENRWKSQIEKSH